MISNPERTTLLSSLGWVDHDALWRFDVTAGRTDSIPLGSGARYVSLHSWGADRFSVGDHFDGARFEVTVHSFSDPREVLARAVVKEGDKKLVGDPSAWRDVPHLYVEYLAFAPWKDFVLLKVCPSTDLLELHRLVWFVYSYDKVYNNGIGVIQ